MSEGNTAYILFSHGSTLCGAGDALEDHAARMRDKLDTPLVEIGYMNYSEPVFDEAVAKLAASGAIDIVVIPFFLVPGYFVSVSLPKRIDQSKVLYPDLRFSIAEPLGADELLADAVIEAAQFPMREDSWRDGLKSAGRQCRNRTDCPLYGSGNCPITATSTRSEAQHAV